MEKLPSKQRVATLNIRHGGKKYEGVITSRLLGYDADKLIVAEFRANDVGERLIGRLRHEGYETSHPGSLPSRNAVLVGIFHLLRTGVSTMPSATRW